MPDDAADVLHLAAWASEGTAPSQSARRVGRPYDPAAYGDFPDRLLRDLDPAGVAAAIDDVGYCVAPLRLAPDIIDDIRRHLDAGPAVARGDGLGSLPPGPPQPTAPTWWMDATSIVRSEGVRRVLSERRVAEVGGHYLGVDPMIMSLVLWKSFAWLRSDSNSAQHFHYDNDRAAFVKMFVYLTDVGPENGPHIYVTGSHRTKPRELLHGDRLADADVERFYPRSQWVTITGASGSVFFADTRGFHKGGRVARGERAMFQINLGSDRFGIHEPSVGPARDAPDELAPLIAVAPRYFSALYTGAYDGP